MHVHTHTTKTHRERELVYTQNACTSNLMTPILHNWCLLIMIKIKPPASLSLSLSPLPPPLPAQRKASALAWPSGGKSVGCTSPLSGQGNLMHLAGVMIAVFVTGAEGGH